MIAKATTVAHHQGPDATTASISLVTAPSGSDPIADEVRRLLSERADVRAEIGDRPDPAVHDVVVACANALPDDRWQDLDALCEGAGLAWHRVHVEGPVVCVGPFTMPGVSAGYRDWRARRLAASRNPDGLLDRWSRADRVPGPRPNSETVVTAAQLVVDDVLAHLRGERAPGADHEVRISGATLTRHPVLPLPGKHSAGTATGTSPEDRLVDARTGIVTALRASRPGPYSSSLACVEAEVCDTRVFAPWRADPAAGGATLGDPDAARRAALGEAVERYCGNAIPPDLPRGTARDLRALGHRVVSPGALTLYSAAQYATPGFPFVPLHDDLTLDWARGCDLVTGDPMLVPAAAVHLNGPGTRPGGPAPVSPPALAGIAAGETATAAQRAAMEEVLERDAVTVWWATGDHATALDVTGDPVIADTLSGPVCGRLDARFLLLPCLVDVPVAAVLLHDPHRGLIGVGTACRPTTTAAAHKALTEALVSLEVARELADPDSPFWTDVRAGRLPAAPYRPFHDDRSYRDLYRADWRDLTSLEPNVQLYLDPRMQAVALARTRPATPAIPLGAGPTVTGDPRSAYLRELTGAGLSAVGVDLTTDDVARAGLRVSRVVVPGLYQLAPAAFPLLGGTRLDRDPDIPVPPPLPFS
ncbi:YcaO-like family protein [Pseudonocardia sp. HH130630-07]|uniref:YcaO-like family protein n=1 Tax=Pseudonocardia sp. HH130630-07 TaxID=1690815 RepID=UPI0012EAE919|nr:YcaO-like family protein [Pseudonocardia sp. HH130630-07]